MRAIVLALGITLLPAAAFAQTAADAAAPAADAAPAVSGYRIAVIAAGTVAGVIAANALTGGLITPAKAPTEMAATWRNVSWAAGGSGIGTISGSEGAGGCAVCASAMMGDRINMKAINNPRMPPLAPTPCSNRRDRVIFGDLSARLVCY